MKIAINFKEDTEALAKDLVSVLKTCHKDKATVLVLSGDLGVGKTTLSQYIGEIFGIKEKISSPTFVLMKKYKIFGNFPWSNFVHIDVYRTDDVGELSVLKLPEVFSDKNNFVIIEWGEKISEILPKDCFLVSLYHKEDNTREAVFDFNV